MTVVKLAWEVGHGHCRVRVFAGPDGDHLALCGTLTFTQAEAERFRLTVRQGIVGDGFTGLFESGWTDGRE